jgi:DNA-binding NtrC family response regulator
METDMFQTLVVVEDDPLLGWILIDLLQSEGYSCLLFVTADDALVHMLKRADEVKLILADYQTPGQLNGVELSRLTYSRWPLIPFILMSGHDSSIISGGAPHVRWLAKPWDTASLLAMVAELHLITS